MSAHSNADLMCRQAWSWLEASGLEANSTCMNAVVGALARGSAWRGPRGLAGGELEHSYDQSIRGTEI
jgi:hypothetical protein